MIFSFFNQPMAVQRKLPTKICKCLNHKVAKASKSSQGWRMTKEINIFLLFPVQTTAHSQKVSCLDIGETGRVLVTGGYDRLVNLFAIGQERPIQVRRSVVRKEMMKSRAFNERGKCVVFRHKLTNNHLTWIHLTKFAIWFAQFSLNFSHSTDITLVSNAFDSPITMIMYTQPTKTESSRNGIWTILITTQRFTVTWRVSGA